MKQHTRPGKSAALGRFLQFLPDAVRPALLAAVAGGEIDSAGLERALTGIDWSAHREALQDLLEAVIPVEELVPDVYENWRPVVRDGFAFLGARLSPERLLPKFVEQFQLPDDTPIEDRVLLFIRRIPSLQKIGQTIARNANLDLGLRERLAVLEDGIREVDEDEIFAEIETGFGRTLRDRGIAIQRRVFAEGSVSALVRFLPSKPSATVPTSGVLKILKPFIVRYFREDLELLAELAAYFDANQAKYALDNINLRAVLDEVRWLFERETDFVNERVSMQAASERYAGIPGLRLPEVFPQLSTRTITVMSDEPGVKITDAFPADAEFRSAIARRAVECLVALPLFSAAESSPFHADPHAGNLRVDECTGDLVLLDWALTESLTLEDRRNLMLLYVTLPLRDEGQLVDALCHLCPSATEDDRKLIRRQVEAFMDVLPLGSVSPADGVSDLMDRLLRAGVRFSGAFLIFRKMLATLGDVVRQAAPDVTIDSVVADYVVQNALRNVEPAREFRIPLQGPDLVRIGFSAQSFVPRVLAQSLRRVARALAARCPNSNRCADGLPAAPAVDAKTAPQMESQ